ncbi:MAG: hypothetical protein E7319_05205 [Clostridiales bacterium]|nr:hypothetical protein [Clostridiales bacterium]
MKRLRVLLAVLLAWCTVIGAGAETLTLPRGTTVIETESFRGCTNLTDAVLPEGVTFIGAGAFADCTALKTITIPASVSSIGAGAFDGIDLPLLIRTEPGSPAMTYALNHMMDFQADTTYRALLIGQSNYDDGDALLGTLSDVQSMNKVLSSFGETPYAVTVKTDLSADGIRASIASTFAGAKPQDVSLFYYSGHGAAYLGALVGVDGYAVLADDLRRCLDAIPGRKIVIVDACFSGALIGKTTEPQDQIFVNAFMPAFTAKARTNLAADSYYVMTAAHSSQPSWEINNGSNYYGAFTTAFAKGCGYDFVRHADCPLYADRNGDKVITFEEAYLYALANASGNGFTQTAQVWPDECSAFGFLR